MCPKISIEAVLRIRDVYPGFRIRRFPSRIPDPGSKRFRIPDPGSGSASEKLSIFLTQKIVSKLSEICSGIFIPDPYPGSRSGFLTHP
jgi:hypothetical protein